MKAEAAYLGPPVPQEVLPMRNEINDYPPRLSVRDEVQVEFLRI